MFWADDLILISKSKEGLQEHLNILADYCEEWKLRVNIDKTKIIIFNKGGRLLKKEVFSYKDKVIEIVKQHRYLGILLDATRKLKTAVIDIAKKAMRATHAIYKLSTYNQISPRLLLQTYNSIIKPILFFSSETWAPEMKPNNDTKNSFLKFCKHILGVNRKAINYAVMSELGVYPLEIDTTINMISFYLYIKGTENILLSKSLLEVKELNTNWMKYLNKIVNYDIENIDSCKYKNNKNKIEGNVDKQLSHETLENKFKKTLYEKYEGEWKSYLDKSTRLEFYRNMTNKYNFENYLDIITNRRHKAAYAKLRISAHKLHIKVGRYKKYDSKLRKYVNPPREERTSSKCKDKVEDEYHFLFDCEKNKTLRDKLYVRINDQITKAMFHQINKIEKGQFLLNPENFPPHLVNLIAKFIHDSFKTA